MLFQHKPLYHEVLECARICHEVNRAYCQSLGDTTQPRWENAPDWQKNSAIAAVEAHVTSNLTMTPEDTHKSWFDHKIAEGWKYGPVKDVDKKEHPCLVHYKHLPPEQRAKDYLSRAVVHSFFARHVAPYAG